MANAKLSLAQASFLKALRAVPADIAKPAKADLFTLVKSTFGIPADHKVKVEIDDISSPNYLVILRKKDNQPYPVAGSAPVVAAPVDTRKWFKVDDLKNSVYDGLDNCCCVDDEDIQCDQASAAAAANGTDFYVVGTTAYILREPNF
jgi:hypothetical protein